MERSRRGGQHRFELVEFGRGETFRFQGVDEVLVDRAVENFFQKRAGQPANGGLPLDARHVDVGLAFAAMADEAFLLHHLQQAEDRGVRELVVALLAAPAFMASARSRTVTSPRSHRTLRASSSRSVGDSPGTVAPFTRWKRGQARS